MSRVLWVPMTRPSSTLLPWCRDYISLVTEQKKERWSSGTGLSNVVDLPGVECQLARSQELWETDYNKFIAELSTFVNKEINDFHRSIMVMSDSIRELRISNTHYRELA